MVSLSLLCHAAVRRFGADFTVRPETVAGRDRQGPPPRACGIVRVCGLVFLVARIAMLLNAAVPFHTCDARRL